MAGGGGSHLEGASESVAPLGRQAGQKAAATFRTNGQHRAPNPQKLTRQKVDRMVAGSDLAQGIQNGPTVGDSSRCFAPPAEQTVHGHNRIATTALADGLIANQTTVRRLACEACPGGSSDHETRLVSRQEHRASLDLSRGLQVSANDGNRRRRATLSS